MSNISYNDYGIYHSINIKNVCILCNHVIISVIGNLQFTFTHEMYFISFIIFSFYFKRDAHKPKDQNMHKHE